MSRAASCRAYNITFVYKDAVLEPQETDPVSTKVGCQYPVRIRNEFQLVDVRGFLPAFYRTLALEFKPLDAVSQYPVA